MEKTVWLIDISSVNLYFKILLRGWLLLKTIFQLYHGEVVIQWDDNDDVCFVLEQWV
jgi:hypothetical protein